MGDLAWEERALISACTRPGYVRPERIVDGVLQDVGPVVFRCPYQDTHRW